MPPPPRRIASDCDSGIEGGDLSQPKSLCSIGLLALERKTRRMHEYAPMNDYCQVFSDSMFSALSNSLNVFKQGCFQRFRTGVRRQEHAARMAHAVCRESHGRDMGDKLEKAQVSSRDKGRAPCVHA